MKKLLTLTAIVAIAASTHAAAIGWTIAGATEYIGGSYDVFVIGMNGVTGVDQIAALVEAGTSVDSYAFYSGGTVAANGSATLSAAASGKSITYSGSGTDSWTGFAVIWTDDGKEASYTSTAAVSLANDSTGRAFGFGNQKNNLAANNFTVAAPEPTSGLLVLLGVAGLALRRRRA